MAFEPVNELERLLIAAAQDLAARSAFMQSLMSSDLYFSPVGDEPLGGGLGPIASSVRPDGTVAPAFFTAPQRVTEALGAAAKTAKRNGLALLTAVREAGAHLNPNLDYSVIWTPADLQEIFDKHRSMVIPPDTKVLPITRDQIPIVLTNALKGAFVKVPGVDEAWLALGDRGEGRIGWLFGVRTHGSWRDIDPVIRKVIDGVDMQGKLFATLPLRDDAFSKSIRESGIPIIAPKSN